MQRDYSDGATFDWRILWSTEDDISDELLCQKEKYYIGKVKSISRIYNQTDGGIGMNGYKYNEDQLKDMSKRVSGSSNPMSKINLEQFKKMVKMFEQGCGNAEVAQEFGLHDRYVSLVRHKKRYQNWYKEYFPDYKPVSAKKFQFSASSKLTDKQVIEIFVKSQGGMSNVELGKCYNVDASTISNIKNRKTHKEVTKDLTV